MQIMPREPLTPKQGAFVAQYLVDLNATQAAIRAGYSAKSAGRQAVELLTKPHISDAIAAAKAKRAERIEVTADMVVLRLWAVMTADPRELVEVRRHACRYCHGVDHRYQYTPAELERDRTEWEKRQTRASKETFDERGGVGYSAKREPHPDCPECHGLGVERVVVHDTRRLSSGAAALYQGVKQTKDGVEVKMVSVEAAWTLIARHVGLGDIERGDGDPNEHARRVREAVRAMDAADEGRA